MARKKVKLAWIENSALRRKTYKKRLLGLFKKLSELTTLCDVQACGIVYGYNESEPEVWPSPPEVGKMVQSFLELPEIEQCKKMSNQQNFLQVRADRLTSQYQRSEMNVHDLELCVLLYKYMCGRDMNELNHNDAMAVFNYADRREKNINDMLQVAMRGEGISFGNVSNALTELPHSEHRNVFPSPSIESQLPNVLPEMTRTSNVANTASNDIREAANTLLNKQMMIPRENIGPGNVNQWLYRNHLGPFN